MKSNNLSILITVFILFSLGCSTGLFNDDSPEIQEKDGKTYIIDNTGKRWEISHAIKNYNMKADKFQFGLGPFAITPIQNPVFLNPGDAGYPNENSSFLVIGYSQFKDSRAYPIDVLTRHEIVDDKFGDIHVAVAY